MSYGSLARRFLSDECGQDMVEYGLLTAIVALAGMLIVPNIVTSMGNAYDSWGQATYDAWDPDPAP